mmetsp:Transcript_90467/g.194039  ORF Transcript_90467/g.194039 Transcript_90467/m.194039 type:complete len:211 (-) Transcript_90467:1717-2349(-)
MATPPPATARAKKPAPVLAPTLAPPSMEPAQAWGPGPVAHPPAWAWAKEVALPQPASAPAQARGPGPAVRPEQMGGSEPTSPPQHSCPAQPLSRGLPQLRPLVLRRHGATPRRSRRGGSSPRRARKQAAAGSSRPQGNPRPQRRLERPTPLGVSWTAPWPTPPSLARPARAPTLCQGLSLGAPPSAATALQLPDPAPTPCPRGLGARPRF